MKKIAIAFDHRGFELATLIQKHLENKGYSILMGECSDADDYADRAKPAILSVKDKKCDVCILICGTGIGMNMVANRFDGIYGVLAQSPADAYFARRHENANALILSAGYSDGVMSVKLSKKKAIEIVDVFLSSQFEGGRHVSRIKKIDKINK